MKKNGNKKGSGAVMKLMACLLCICLFTTMIPIRAMATEPDPSETVEDVRIDESLTEEASDEQEPEQPVEEPEQPAEEPEKPEEEPEQPEEPEQQPEEEPEVPAEGEEVPEGEEPDMGEEVQTWFGTVEGVTVSFPMAPGAIPEVSVTVLTGEQSDACADLLRNALPETECLTGYRFLKISVSGVAEGQSVNLDFGEGRLLSIKDSQLTMDDSGYDPDCIYGVFTTLSLVTDDDSAEDGTVAEEPGAGQFQVYLELGEEAVLADVMPPEAYVDEEGYVRGLTDPVWQDAEGNDVMYFLAWFTDPEFNEVFDETAPVTEDITLYACWAPEIGEAFGGAEETFDIGNNYNYINAEKTFSGKGLTEADVAKIKDAFSMTLTQKDENGQIIASYPMNGTDATLSGLTLTWRVENVTPGTYIVTETGDTIENYNKINTLYNGDVNNQVTIKAGTFTAEEKDYQTTCGKKNWPIGIEGETNRIFAVALTTGDVIIVSDAPLSMTEKNAVNNALANGQASGQWKLSAPHHYFDLEHDKGWQTVEGKRFEITDGEVILERTDGWTHCTSVIYNINAVTAELSVENFYERDTTDLIIHKNISGSMAEVSRNFEFKVFCTVKPSESSDYRIDTVEGGYLVTFYLTDDQSITLKDVQIGDNLIIKETDADNYDSFICVNSEPDKNNPDHVLDNNEGYAHTVGTNIDTIYVENNREGSPDTGVILDSLPYVLILAVVIGGFLLMHKRKNRYND